MLNKKIIQASKATISVIIVALLLVGIIYLATYLFFGQEIDTAVVLLNTVAVELDENKEEVPTVLNEEKQTLENYPEYGTQYATIEIPRIGANLPVYFGDTLEILKKGVGHSSGSYFPGEGGSIVYMGHNSKKVFRRFSELQIGDSIKVTTTYGEFNYKIYDMQLIKETELEKVPIQREEEILMVYTCYPFNNIGYADHRFVVYAKLEQ